MEIQYINAKKAHDLKSGYSQAVEVSGHDRTVFVSGQIPVRPDASVPETFAEQAKQAWANIEAQLNAADMGMDNIVRHTTYLSDRKYGPENTAIRRQVLEGLAPALTLVIAGIFDEAWLLEIEAVAAA